MSSKDLTADDRQWCRVYWGSHGCDLPRGHSGPHRCSCADDPGIDPETREYVDDPGCFNVGAVPYYGPDTHFYGEDAPFTHRLRNIRKNYSVWGWRISWNMLWGRE